MIKRSTYINQIKKVLNKQVVKVLLGMRRVGKSTLLMQIQDELIANGVTKEQIISLNFEWLEYESLKNYMELHDYIISKKHSTKKTYLFLDEIQEVEGFEKVISSFNAKDDYELFVTGSNSSLLSGELASYLTGRYYKIEVLPLSYNEYLQGNQATQENLIEYIVNGGMPGALQFDDREIAKNYLLDMYQAILLRDIVKRYKIRDVDLLQRFMLYLMNNIGQTFSAGTITKYLKSEGRNLSKETIYNFLEAAKNAYLIHGMPRYNIKGKAIMQTNEKYFINDLGMRSLYFDNQEDIGQALENIVYLELKRRGYTLYVGKAGEREVDFIAVKGTVKIYIQVTYILAEKSTIEREFSVLEAIDDNYAKWVISMDPVNRSRNGIVHKNIIDFLIE